MISGVCVCCTAAAVRALSLSNYCTLHHVCVCMWGKDTVLCFSQCMEDVLLYCRLTLILPFCSEGIPDFGKVIYILFDNFI